jgi:hypothetical protein
MRIVVGDHRSSAIVYRRSEAGPRILPQDDDVSGMHTVDRTHADRAAGQRVRSSDFSVTACALPVLVTVLVTVWMPLVNVTAGARFVAQGLRQEGFRADSISRHGRAAVMTMGISEHAFNMMTWFAKNFGRYGCQFRWSALMPTLSKAQLTGRDSPWGAAFDQMYLGLCRDRVSILTALGFYAEHDLPPPEENPDANPTTNEEEELRQIASALRSQRRRRPPCQPVYSPLPF